MKRIIQISWLIILLISVPGLKAQDVYNLWDGLNKPHYKENNLQEYEKELWETRCLFNVTEPTLTVYSAVGENSGKAVIIIPGGGYELVAMHHEGYDVAEQLSNLGITAAVLKYRLPNPESSDLPQMVPLTDTRRAMVLLREKAEKYGFDSEKLGLLGFSAGSHLATVASLWESANKNENPNYSVLIYGVTNLSEDNRKWLEESLYFRELTEKEISQNTLLDLVTEDTPPTFLVHAMDDDVCLVEESTLYARQLQDHKVSVEIHLFAKGGHGFGLGRNEDGTDQWIDLFARWLMITL